MITKFNFFESIKDEFPGMFAPEKEEDKPQVVPGFEDGTIDPDDTEPWEFGGKIYNADSDKYEKFIKITKERNFKETPTKLIINLKRLYHDFYMSIYNPTKHFKKFIDKELIGKYISSGYNDMMDDTIFEGIIEKVEYTFDTYSAFLELKLKNQKKPKYAVCSEIITIDKVKSTANKYNL